MLVLNLTGLNITVLSPKCFGILVQTRAFHVPWMSPGRLLEFPSVHTIQTTVPFQDVLLTFPVYRTNGTQQKQGKEIICAAH